MKKLSKRDKKVLTIGGVLAAGIVLLMYVVFPFFEAQQSSADALRNKERMLQKAIQTVQRKDVYKAQVEELNLAFNQYRRNLLDSPTTSEAAIQLEQIVREIANQNGVRITRTSPIQDRKIEDRYARITVQLNMEANTTQLTNFLYALSTHPKFLLVDDFFLNSFRIQDQIQLQPRMNVSGFVRLS